MSAMLHALQWGQNKPDNPGALVDRNHPLSNQLLGAYLFNEQAGLKAINSAKPRFNATRASLAAYSPAPNGRGGIGVSCQPTLTNSIQNANSWVTGTTYTIATRIKIISAAGSFGSLWTNAGANGGFYVTGGGTINFSAFFGGNHLNTTALTAGVWYDYVFTVLAGAGQHYLNGNTDGTAASVVTQTLVTIGSDSASETLNAVIDYLYFWNRALKQSEVRQLRAEPYGIFVPQRRRFARPATGGPSINSGAGSAAGVATAIAVGASIAAVPANAVGAGTAIATGASIAAVPANAAGAATAIAPGTAVTAGAANASGTGTATATGAAVASSVANAAGVATAATEGTSNASGVANAVGASTATAVGSGSLTPVVTPTTIALDPSTGGGVKDIWGDARRRDEARRKKRNDEILALVRELAPHVFAAMDRPGVIYRN